MASGPLALDKMKVLLQDRRTCTADLPMKQADWCFDFVSPFAYLQLGMLDEVAKRATITLQPVLLAGILNHFGQKGPAEILGKRQFTYQHVQWLAESRRVPMRFPPTHPFNPLKALRLAVALHAEPGAIRTIFMHIWRDGRSLEANGDWEALCTQLLLPNADAVIQEQWVKDVLADNGRRALAAGVFGVPTFVIDGRVFWGADSTQMVIDYLDNPARFSSGEFARLAVLPIGAERRRPLDR
jgi:2-hydroxychromene-2-carboxylate isomerase